MADLNWDEVQPAKKPEPGGYQDLNWDAVKPLTTTPTPGPETQPIDEPAVLNDQTRSGVKSYDTKIAEKNAAYKGAFEKDNTSVDMSGEEASGGPKFAFQVGKNLDQGGIKSARERLREEHPDGDLVEKNIPKYGKVLFYNDKPGEPYKLFGHELSTEGGKHLNLRNVLGLSAAAATGGMSIPAAAMLGGGSAFIGSALDSILQKVSNNEPNLTGPEMATRAVQAGVGQGVFQAGFGALGAIPGMAKAGKEEVLNFLFRRTSPEVNAIVEGVKREGLDPLAIGQVADNPMTRALVRQGATTSPILADMNKAQMTSLQTKLEQYAAEGKELSTGDLHLLSDLRKIDILGGLGDISHLDHSEASALLQKGLQNYEASSAGVNNKQYGVVKTAAANEDIHFKIDNLINTAADIENGVLAPGQKRLPNWAEQLDAEGAPVAGGTVQVGGPTREIRPYIDQIKKLSPTLKNVQHPDIETSSGLVEGKVSSALDQLQAIRSGLYDLMHQTNDRQTRMQATQLWHETATVMSAPENASPTTSALIKIANNFNADREATLSPLRALINKQDPGNMAANLVTPGKFQTLVHLRKTLTDNGQPEAWTAIQDGFKSDLLTDPSKIAAKLDKFNVDKKTLDTVITPQEQQLFREVGNQHKRWESGEIADIIKGVNDKYGNALRLALKGSPEELDGLMSTVANKKQLALDMRSGIYQHILDQSMQTVENKGKMIIPSKVIEVIDELEKSGIKARLDRFMSPKDWDRLRTFADYSASIDSMQGAGAASLGAMSKLSVLKSPLQAMRDPGHYAFTWLGVFNNNTWARILATPATADTLAKAVQQGPTKAGLRTVIGASMSAYADTKRRED